MKRILLPLLALGSFLAACKKDDDSGTPTTPGPTNPGACADGSVCFTLNGTALSKTGGGYVFADTFTFVKYEDGGKQLSIDIFGNTSKTYPVGEARLKDRARIYYFPDADRMYLAPSGSLSLTALANKKASGTFSGTLYRYNSTSQTFTMTDSMVVTAGSFTNVALQ